MHALRTPLAVPATALRPSSASAACLASLLSLVLTLAARPAHASENNWNQWDEPAVSGIGRGTSKLSLGVDWGHVPGSHALRLGFGFEHMLRDHWGLTAQTGLPIDGEWIAPLLLGVRFHALPKSPVDPFVGVSGGAAWMRPTGRDARVDPMASAQAGVTVYYFGLLFLELHARYDVARYAAAEGAVDRSGLALAGATGVFF
jgi:hypothetical protein